MKLNVVTLSDYRYLPKGLCLYDSLIKTNSDFTLHYLCLDKQSYEKLNNLSLDNIVTYSADDLADNNPLLKNLKINDYWYFCMTCASFFMNYLFETGVDELTYADSDIFFHKSINELVDVFGDKQIAIFRHRQFPLEQPRPEGWFNVGVVHFKNGKFGNKILKWWSDAVLNKKHPELATCGDQKYLDMFPSMCPEEFIFIDGGIGHGAPWQWQLYNLDFFHSTGKIIYRDQEQVMYFTHFSQFSIDFDKKNYVPSTMHHIYTPLNMYQDNISLKAIYQDYFKNILVIQKKYEL